VSFEVDRQKNLLNDIFGFAPIQTDTSAISGPRHRSQVRRQRCEKGGDKPAESPSKRGAQSTTPFSSIPRNPTYPRPYFRCKPCSFVTSRPGGTSNIHSFGAKDPSRGSATLDPAVSPFFVNRRVISSAQT